MKIAKDSVVTFDYTLTDDTGEVLDSSQGAEPLVYLHGAGNIIPGLEQELETREAGDAFSVTVQPAEGYGEPRPELRQAVPREAFGDIEDIQPGMQFEAAGEGGQRIPVTVVEVNETEIVVDGNHPLAGEVLKFDVTVVGVRAATEDEIAHGHVHGDGGVHH